MTGCNITDALNPDPVGVNPDPVGVNPDRVGLHPIPFHQPDRPAVIYLEHGKGGSSRRVSWTFRQLDEQSTICAQNLCRSGVSIGDRVLILARPDRYFIPFILGLIRSGAVPVFIDPGRPLQELLGCIKTAQPAVLVAPPPLQALVMLFPDAFKTVRRRIVPTGWFPGAVHLPGLLEGTAGDVLIPETNRESEAAVIFTTGSTGIPKAIAYHHGHLQSQCEALKNSLNLSEGEVGLFGLSAMMLIGLMAGVTSIVTPDLNDSPGRINLEALTGLLRTCRATVTFASPLLCKRLVAYCQPRGLTFPDLRRLVVGGAPVPAGLVSALQKLLPGGDVIVSLGSTEVMPAAMISGQEALRRSAPSGGVRAGICTGYPPPGHSLRIIPILDGPVPVWKDDLCLPTGEIGEIVIKGPAVTGAYLHQPGQTALAKIGDEDGNGAWHRMGDVGYLDEDNCLWFCGRKSHRVQTGTGTLFTVPCEAVFNQHPGVERSALVGLGRRGAQRPVIVIEAKPGNFPKTANTKKVFIGELLALGRRQPHTRGIEDFVFYPGVFPVDIRHNSKILRDQLANWVERNLKSGVR